VLPTPRIGCSTYRTESERLCAPLTVRSRILVRDTWNTEIVPELRPQADDVIIYKHRYSGFYETDLGSRLKRAGTKYLIVIGCTTSVCVESTVRDSMFRDCSCVVLAERFVRMFTERFLNPLRSWR
jgi:ureidoacrylate peracid hydrolase